MNDGFIDLRQNHAHLVEDSFWPSFTDIMTVVVMIFLIATSILIVKNWELVTELQTRIVVEQKISQRLKDSIAEQQKTSQELEDSLSKRQEISRKLQSSMEAERRTAETIKQTSAENATLEETLTHTQSELSMMRLQLMQAKESAKQRDRLIVEQDKQLTDMNLLQKELQRVVQSRSDDISELKQQLLHIISTKNDLRLQFDEQAMKLSRIERNLKEQHLAASVKQQELDTLNQKNQQYVEHISHYEKQAVNARQQHSTLTNEYKELEIKYNQLIRPSRSAIGKHVVEVRYEKIADKEIIQFRASNNEAYQTLSYEAMHQKLDKLKQQYQRDLYVKIIIPDNSGLSYNEAWSFMMGLLNKYDYYYQDE